MDFVVVLFPSHPTFIFVKDWTRALLSNLLENKAKYQIDPVSINSFIFRFHVGQKQKQTFSNSFSLGTKGSTFHKKRTHNLWFFKTMLIVFYCFIHSCFILIFTYAIHLSAWQSPICKRFLKKRKRKMMMDLGIYSIYIRAILKLSNWLMAIKCRSKKKTFINKVLMLLEDLFLLFCCCCCYFPSLLSLSLHE